MRLPKNQPFWTSLILHLVVLLGLFFATIVEAFRPKEPPHVFEMVTLPDAADRVETPAAAVPAPDLPALDMPEVPDLVDPQPPAPPQPVAQPVERPRLISREEFIRQFGEPTPRQPTQNTPARPNITVPKIDVPRLVVPANPSPSNPGPQELSSRQKSALGTYSTRLRSRIDAAWGKPTNLAGARIAATVVFDVSASGRITNVRLKPGSGNRGFDQSVLAAFRRITSAGPTPTGQPHTFTMTFRMSD